MQSGCLSYPRKRPPPLILGDIAFVHKQTYVYGNKIIIVISIKMLSIDQPITTARFCTALALWKAGPDMMYL